MNDLVAFLVAFVIIDAFESVDVGDQDRDRQGFRISLKILEDFFDIAPIIQPGQDIMIAVIFLFRLFHDAVGDISG